MPSKGLLRPYEALAEVKRVPGAAEAVTGELDVPAVLRRRDEIIHDLDDSVQLPWLEDKGIALYRGRGKVVGERRVDVELNDGGSAELEAAKAVFLAGGTLPRRCRRSKGWTRSPTRGRTARRRRPRRSPTSMVIMGGGVVGVEMSQAYTSLGARSRWSRGTARSSRARRWFACEQVTESLEEQGATSAAARRRRRSRRTAAKVTRHADRRLVGERRRAARRARPHAADRDSSGSRTSASRRGSTSRWTSTARCPATPWLYAIGDVNGRALFTHMGKYQARDRRRPRARPRHRRRARRRRAALARA